MGPERTTAAHRPRVLFVDDDPHVLAALRRSLHLIPRSWDIDLVGSGEAALARLETSRYEAIVSDLRMPAMDGAELLSLVQQRAPGTVRMVLSGEAERSTLLRSAAAAHQILSKPCDSATLVAAIERALQVFASLGEPALRDLIGGVHSLPTIPAVYAELVDVVAEPDCSLERAADVVAKDVATSVEVLKLTNSAFFGLPHRIEPVHQAVAMLGMDALQSLVLAGSTFRGDRVLRGVSMQELRGRALKRVAMARRVTRAEQWPNPEAATLGLAAMLREVGALVLAEGRPEAAERLAGEFAAAPWLLTDPHAVHQAEHAAFGCTVPRAGAYLLGLWGFSPAVQRVIGGQPVRGGESGADLSEVMLTVLHQLALWPDSTADDLVELVAGIECAGEPLSEERVRRWVEVSAPVNDLDGPAGTGVSP